MRRSWKRVLLVGSFLLMSVSVLASAEHPNAEAESDNPAASGLEGPAATTPEGQETVARPEGWTDETHGSDAAPNYEVVFPQDRVNEITITLAQADWEAMRADLAEALSPDNTEKKGLGPRNPMWVPATLEFEGNRWTKVGVRYKGNLTLRDTWSNGLLNLPLKLDFDEFEDDNPEIRNQRFYGFKQLALANSLHDETFLRDALTYDLLEKAGLVAAETAHYQVYLDYGQGRVRLGLYNMIEVIDDTVIRRYFQDDGGNIYEGDGEGGSLAEGTFEQIGESFLKENNQKDKDWGDIEALYGVLHSEERGTNPAEWRARLESVFDVEVFLKWLALGAVIDHWDSYGVIAHNYYLYKDPGAGRLTWVSWDHDLVLGGGGTTSLDKKDVGAAWPLIRYLLDDPIYYAAYLNYLEETMNGVFDPDEIEAKYRETIARLEPYAAEGIGLETFHSAVQSLFQFTRDRANVANEFLATHGTGN